MYWFRDMEVEELSGENIYKHQQKNMQIIGVNNDRRYGIDPTKIKNDLGWYPETYFEKGIALTIDWYLEYEDWMNVTAKY